MKDYTKLDAEILSAVGDGLTRFREIFSRVNTRTTGYNERQVDRRLQGLRRAGKLIYRPRAGWQKVVTP